MSNFSMFFTNSTWILLPLMIFLIYEAYSENINNKKNETLLGFILFSTLYLIIRFGNFGESTYILEITFDTVIVIYYMKNHYYSGLLISVFGLFFLQSQFYFSPCIKFIVEIAISRRYIYTFI